MKKMMIIKEEDTGLFAGITNTIGRMFMPSMGELMSGFDTSVEELVDFVYTEFSKLEKEYGEVEYDLAIYDHFHAEVLTNMVSMPKINFTKVLMVTMPFSTVFVNLYGIAYSIWPAMKNVAREKDNNPVARFIYNRRKKLLKGFIASLLKHEFRHVRQFAYLKKLGEEKMEQIITREGNRSYSDNRLEFDARLCQWGINLPLAWLTI